MINVIVNGDHDSKINLFTPDNRASIKNRCLTECKVYIFESSALIKGKKNFYKKRDEKR